MNENLKLKKEKIELENILCCYKKEMYNSNCCKQNLNNLCCKIKYYELYINQLETEINLLKNGTNNDKNKEIEILKRQNIILQEELINLFNNKKYFYPFIFNNY
jgi:hypothetical protein